MMLLFRTLLGMVPWEIDFLLTHMVADFCFYTFFLNKFVPNTVKLLGRPTTSGVSVGGGRLMGHVK